MLRGQPVEDGRIILETPVQGLVLRFGRDALDRLARQVAVESYRADGVPVRDNEARERAA